MKICTKCKIEKPLTEFYKNTNAKRGLTHPCKDCTKKINRIWYHENKAKVLNRVSKHYHKNKDRIKERKKKYHAEMKKCTEAYHEIYNRPETIQQFREKWFSERSNPANCRNCDQGQKSE